MSIFRLFKNWSVISFVFPEQLQVTQYCEGVILAFNFLEWWVTFLELCEISHTHTHTHTESINYINCIKKLHFLKNIFLKYFIYFLRGERKRKRGRETSMCGCLMCAPYWGPGLQPRHVPYAGNQTGNPLVYNQHSIHWATPARARNFIFKVYISLLQKG